MFIFARTREHTRHDDLKSLIFLAEDVLYRNHNVLQVNERRATAGDTRVVYLLSLDTGHHHIKDEDREALGTRRTSSGGTESVCGQLPLRDPLLLSVDDPVLPILGLFGRGGETSHIGTGWRWQY